LSLFFQEAAMPIKPCSHVPAQLHEAHASGCEECLATGDTWVHLRLCVHCGHVGCCDDSKNRHASKHHAATGHTVIRSLEPGESWMWCYEHRLQVG
jgi:uncharacterized UBP type Zn finger protein